MNLRSPTFALLACAACLAGAGCNAPGKPKLRPEASRPEQVLDFPALYKQNCAGCHGENGKNGAAISLANPVYLATAGADNIRRITADGVPGTAMAPYGEAAGGMLTDRQIDILATGMMQAWSRADALGGVAALPYASAGAGDPMKGQASYSMFCARCHGADAVGMNSGKATQTGSIVDPAYLALVSDQSLRTVIIAGQPEQGMPDWRSDIKERAMTDREVSDVVAWIASHRTVAPGQPYQ